MSGITYTKQQIKEIKELDGVMIINHVAHAKCGSSDAATYYQKEYHGKDVVDGFCYSCSSYIDPNENHNVETVDVDEIEEINTEKLEEIDKLASRGWRERKITKSTSEFYGVRTELDSKGSVLNRYYPCQNSRGETTRYKVRNCVEKNFWSVGKKARKEQFFGQHLFPKGGKYIVIAGGEEDAMSAFQMLKTSKYTTPCISPTNGEGSLAKQIQDNFDYITSFEAVILMMDNDKAGKEAAEAAMKLLRPQQGRVWKPVFKDVNEYLINDEEAQFKNVFFKAEHITPAGIVGSSDSKIWDAILDRAKSIKIPLPAFAEDLQDKLRGGPALGEITTLAAASSIGKTSILNAFTYFWIMNAPYKVGIISLESDLGELGENLLSCHIGTKLANLYDEEKIHILNEDMKEKFFQELAVTEEGEDRFTILDHQSAIMDDELKRKIEHMVKVEGCKIIILDPLTLALSGSSNDGMDAFNAWYLRFVKREQIAAFNVLHVRKNQGGQRANSRGAEISEEDIKGCLDKDTEVLTPAGWVKISEWSGESIAEFNADTNNIEYREPTEYIKLPCQKMYRFHNKTNLDMVLSGEHTILHGTQGSFKTITVDEMLFKGVGNKLIPTTFSQENMTTDFDKDILRLQIMVAADGCYHGNGLCKISFTKQRKIDRCRMLLEKAGVPYTTTSPKGRPEEVVFRFKAFSESKHLQNICNWYTASKAELEVLLEECLYWDGTLKDSGDVFYTTIEEEANVVQFAGACLGRTIRINKRMYECNKVYYEVSVPKRNSAKNKVMLRGDNSSVEDFYTEDGFKYCFTTTTGFFVARRNGHIFVTGNSGSIFQTSMNIWLFMRDKNSDNPIVQNTTKVVQSKARRTGQTGSAGYWFYNNETGEFEKGRNPEDIDADEDMKMFEEMGALNDDDPDDFLQEGGY